jgi:hypothetical protein
MPNIKFLNKEVRLPKDNVHVYALPQPKISRDSIMTLAKKFGMEGSEKKGSFHSDYKTLAYSEGNLSLRQCLLSGGLRFRNEATWQDDDGKSALKISDDAAAKIASAFHSSLKLTGEKESKIVKVTHLTVATMQRDSKEANTRVIDSGVVLQRLIEGIPVEGPGGKVMIYIDRTEKTTGFDHYWRVLGKIVTTLAPNQLLTPAVAEEDLRKYWANATGDIEVHEIRFGYFEAGWGEEQAFLQPAYVMPLTLISGDGRIRAGSIHVISAVPKPPAVIMPPAPKIIKQDPRNK